MKHDVQREYPVQGAGLGFRRDLIDELSAGFPEQVSFMEVAPENWMRVGGKQGRIFREFTERHDFVCHGLSLSIGSPAPLDESFVKELKGFLDFLFQIDWNNLSLYDLVINVDKLGIDAAAEMIVNLAKTEYIQECGLTALESMEKLSLLKKVEAAVMKDNINPQELHIEVPEPGMVKLTGLINPMRTVAGVTELIKSVPGVEKIICEAERHPMAKM